MMKETIRNIMLGLEMPSCQESSKKKDQEIVVLERCQQGEQFGEKVYVPPFFTEDTQCPYCGGTGFREYWQNGYHYTEPCRCYQKQIAERAMKKAGINQCFTFDNFIVKDAFQKRMYAVAEDFAKNGCGNGYWFYVGGQSGSGKTHICTAIINQLIREGKKAYYMIWSSESRCLKAMVTAVEEYEQHLMRLCNVQILYIDDMLKTCSGTPPTSADFNLLYQIINYRYQNKDLITIISSEFSLTKVIEMNEAIGSRIFEKSANYLIFNEIDMKHNFRLTNKEE